MSSNEEKIFEVSTVFKPSAPIDNRELFSGRLDKIRTVINAINQAGQHVVIYGERGVGKTSLANVIHAFLPQNESAISIKLNCDADTNFKMLFCEILSEIKMRKSKSEIGFNPTTDIFFEGLNEQFNKEELTPNLLRRIFSQLEAKIIIIIDEFDRIKDENTKRLLSDTIKNFSDYSVDTTFVLVGVADSVNNLIESHNSIERALVQIQMPRMMPEELSNIIEKGLNILNLKMEESVKSEIVNLSQGLPHYTHLLSLYAAQAALSEEQTNIKDEHLKNAIDESINKAQQTIRDDYYKAISSPRGNLYKQVLLACAMAKNDEMGYFAAVDIKQPLKEITGRSYEIAAFAKHLKEFCDVTRGPVLKKSGYPRRYRYRFCNPLMEPFIILDGKNKKLIK
jgi:Cdc6-like AAA superfamily ATPase